MIEGRTVWVVQYGTPEARRMVYALYSSEEKAVESILETEHYDKLGYCEGRFEPVEGRPRVFACKDARMFYEEREIV